MIYLRVSDLKFVCTFTIGVEDVEMKEDKEESKQAAEIKTDAAGFPSTLEGFKYAFNESKSYSTSFSAARHRLHVRPFS